jgi:hypothetical protein
MQSNQSNINKFSYISNDIYHDLIYNIIKKNNNKIHDIINNNILNNNIDLKSFIIYFINFIIKFYNKYVTIDFLHTFEFIIHLDEKYYYNNLKNYFINSIQKFIY